MKLLHLILFSVSTTLCLAGEAKPNLNDPVTLEQIMAQAINEDELRKRGEEGAQLYYAPNSQTPYTGWVVKHVPNLRASISILSRLYQLKDGKLHGLSTWWYENGKKSGEANYVDGKAHGLETWWYENGQKSSETNYVDGKLHGTDTRWFDNGQKGRESNLKDSRRHGLETEWDKEGNVTRQVRYENGQQVETIK